ncbi:MAG TPA: FkbM family methyltransferase [Labilithrix sp.]|nr:FkbM family methyltransferase [Labilithrix sp.]
MQEKTTARDELQKLLSEPVEAARARAAGTFDEIAEGAPIVLFGAGGLGKRMALALTELGTPPVAFADNDPARAGTELVGVPVLSTADALERYGSDAVFVVSIWRNPATERMCDRIDHLRQRGAKRVTSFVTLSWKYPDAFLPYYSMDLPHRVLEARDDVFRAFELLADEPSRAEFVAHLRLRLHVDFAGLPGPVAEPQYFASDIYRLRDDERFVDCGAYDGDTLRSLLRQVPDFRGRIAAFEPDASNFARLQGWRDALRSPLRESIDVFRLGVGGKRERVSFSDGGGTGSAIGRGAVEIDVVALDDVLSEMRASMIKADVDGYEIDVLEGARRLIGAHAPILALSSYHVQDHLWRLPLMAAAMHPGYRLTLRGYGIDGWELVLYAVPEDRQVAVETMRRHRQGV